jgi:putative peptide maturation dehydrogenase
MRVRRCANLIFEPREELAFDLDSLAGGGDGLRTRLSLLALAPHLQQEIDVSSDELAVLAAIPCTAWSALALLEPEHGAPLLRGLLDKGLLVSDAAEGVAVRERDDRLRAANWRSLSAAQHYFSRWHAVRSGEDSQRSGYLTLRELIGKLGDPPPPSQQRVAPEARIALPRPEPGAFDALLRRRATCRNFDSAAPLSQIHFAHMLQRVFGAHGTLAVGGNEAHAVIKRGSPSGGGLHPTEAYLLVQRVEGLASGLYHYRPVEHALEPLQALDAADAADLALRSVAAQTWFANAPVLVVLVSRFPRSFWKYRNHAKAYRVVTLDVGHLSQTLYLSATDLGLGAFITAAINEGEIEQAFGLDPLVESAMAVCGFGVRGRTCETPEFDPGHAVWRADGTLIGD